MKQARRLALAVSALLVLVVMFGPQMPDRVAFPIAMSAVVLFFLSINPKDPWRL